MLEDSRDRIRCKITAGFTVIPYTFVQNCSGGLWLLVIDQFSGILYLGVPTLDKTYLGGETF